MGVTFDDFPHGSGERTAARGLDSNRGADQIVGQGIGIAFEEGPPGVIGEPLGDPARERGRELAVEGIGEDASHPGRDIDEALGAEPREALFEIRIDAALDVLVALHYTTCYYISDMSR